MPLVDEKGCPLWTVEVCDDNCLWRSKMLISTEFTVDSDRFLRVVFLLDFDGSGFDFFGDRLVLHNVFLLDLDGSGFVTGDRLVLRALVCSFRELLSLSSSVLLGFFGCLRAPFSLGLRVDRF